MTNRHFTAHHHGTDKHGLAALLEAFANDQWIGEHYTEEQAVEAVMDRFKRLLEAELEMVEVARLLRLTS
ncbi:MAG: hypothetical protein IT423_11725 [Pirellulaceae bacterium]|nr:hypothetical protein [Pirellulaceae bacterium]